MQPQAPTAAGPDSPERGARRAVPSRMREGISPARGFVGSRGRLGQGVECKGSGGQTDGNTLYEAVLPSCSFWLDLPQSMKSTSVT